MPELPEVETVRRSLAPWLSGRCIRRVHVFSAHVVEGDPDAFRADVEGACITRLDRRGKYLLLLLGGTSTLGALAIHLRMTGRLLYVAPPGGEPQVQEGAPGIYAAEGPALALGWQAPDWLTHMSAAHTHLALAFDDGGALLFNDVRKFGRVAYWPEGARRLRGRMGPEPLSAGFTAKRLAGILQGRSAPLKAALLDQRRVAGLGNIYVDEALWRARLHPLRAAGSLAGDEVRRLHRAIRAVLRAAITHQGTTFRDFRDGLGGEGKHAAHLRVYGRTGEPCTRCGRPISKIVVAQRGTHLCTHCQRPS